MSSRVFATLLYLVENAGQTATKDDMLHALWPGRIADEANLSQAIWAVRKALAESGSDRGLIATVPGRGYCFTAAVDIEQPPPAKPVIFEHVEGAKLIAAPRRSRRWPFAAIATGLTGALIAFAWLTLWRAPPLPAGQTSVVLADVDNATGDPVFDHVIGRALQIDLGQSPFLDLASDTKIADTLELMGQPKGSPLTPELARSVCSRTNGGAVVAASILSLAGHYLVTLTATDCVSDRILDAEKLEAADKQGVLSAIDQLASRLRRRLGESRASIAKFDVPLLSQKTSSFAAIQAYSEGVWLHDHDRLVDAIAMLNHAIQLDQNFAMAHALLANVYYDAKQPKLQVDQIGEAYKLRNFATEPDNLYITALYEQYVTKDVEAAISNLKIWTQIYSSNATAWANLSNLLNWIGWYPDAVAAGRHALAINDHALASYSVLMRALSHSGRMAEAQRVGAKAMAKGVDGGDTLGQLIGEAYLLGDKATMQKLIGGAAGKPTERDALLEAADVTFSEGRMRAASNMDERAIELGRPQGLLDTAASSEALVYALVGLKTQSLSLMKTIPPPLRVEDYRYAQALVGDPARVRFELARDLKLWPQDTPV